MKKLIFIMSIFILFFNAGVVMAAMKIKLDIPAKPGSPQDITAKKFKELLEKQSNGDIRVQIFHFKTLGNEIEILQKIQMNTDQMGILNAASFKQFDPIVNIIHYPFLFKDTAQADKILEGPLGEKILKSLERVGVIGLCFLENGFWNLLNNKHPVKNPDDINGLKIQVMDSDLHKAIWQVLGAIPMPMSRSISADPEQGVIDGQENFSLVMDVHKSHETWKYMTLTHHIYSPDIAVVSLKWWKTLSPDTQDLIQKAICEAAVFQRNDHRSKNAVQLMLFKEKGGQVVENPDIDAFRIKVAGIQDMDFYSEPRVQALLIELLNVTR